MSNDFTARLRRFGAGTAAILLLLGGTACGGGNSERDDRSRTEERDRNRDRDREGGNDSGGKGMLGGGGTDRPERNETVTRDDRPATGGARRDNEDRRVRIVNNSGQVITFIRGSATSERDWGRDRIPTTTLGAGGSTIVDFNDNNGECRYDLQATLQDGSTREERDVNICRVSEWTITADGSSTR